VANRSKSHVKQERAFVTREAILRAAGIAFSTLSFSEAKLLNIAEEAGVTQGALYFHFASKNDLAVEVIKRQHETSSVAGYEQLKDPRGIEGLIISSQILAKQITTDPIVRAGLRLSTESSNLFPGYVEVPYQDWIENCEKFVRKGISDGDIIDSVDVFEVGTFIMESFTGTQVVSQAMTHWADLPQRLEQMWKIMLPAFVVPERKAELLALVKSYFQN
jgi:AcrR family transcriptional regulator